MKRILLLILLLIPFSAEAQRREGNGFFVSSSNGAVLLSGQKARPVGSLTEIEYDGKIKWVAGGSIGYQLNSIAVDLGISYFNSAFELDTSGISRTQVCIARACLVGERKNFLASLGGTIYFLGNESLVTPYITLRAGMARSHMIFREHLNLTPNQGQGVSNQASAGMVKIDSKSYVPFAQVGAGVGLSYGLGIGYKLMWLGSQRGRAVAGYQDELELMHTFNHIVELNLTLMLQ